MTAIFVVGAGAWGTALAHVAAIGGSAVTLCGRDAKVVAAINSRHRNPAYLGDADIHLGVNARLGTAGIESADLVILAVAAQASRKALAGIGAPSLKGKPVVLCAKGLEHGSCLRQSQILAEVAPGALPQVLSGPSFAADVARSKPTAVTLAGPDPSLTAHIAALLAGPTFRPYASDDVIGVELAGALKNVFAIACGAVEGAGLGLSARSAVLARSFAELTRLVTALGGEAATLTGLAGLGDLALSCTTRRSRNFDHGFRLAAGESPASGLVEGIHTAPVALMLAQRAKVDAPIIAAVNALISGKAAIGDLVEALMARPLKREGEK
ncbi:MAG: NAD(P)H-dependent glycerol-3-phosphate dehydrogenase [Cucumibacter sp.]